MKTFEKWLERKRLSEEFDTPDDGFKINNGQDSGTDYDHTLQELMKVVMSKYEQETLQFLQRIADRGDEEIINLVAKLKHEERPVSHQKPSHSNDEVVPSFADTGHGQEGDVE